MYFAVITQKIGNFARVKKMTNMRYDKDEQQRRCITNATMKTEFNLIGDYININLKSKVEVATPGWQREVRIGRSNFEKTLLNIYIY